MSMRQEVPGELGAGNRSSAPSLLTAVRPLEFTVLGITAVILLGVAFPACYVPAHRAMGVNPIVALRHE